MASIGESSKRRVTSAYSSMVEPHTLAMKRVSREIERGRISRHDVVDAGILQADGVEHARRRFVYAVRRVAQPRRQRRALQHDGAGVAVREAFDARVFVAEAHAARQQHDGRAELEAAEVDVLERRGPALAWVRQPCRRECSRHVPRRDAQPEIPPNTGNIIRLCANTGARLHLVEPLGFTLDEPRLRRAGLDYHEWTKVAQHAEPGGTVLPRSAAGACWRCPRAGTGLSRGAVRSPATRCCSAPETSGLPQAVLDALPPAAAPAHPDAAGQPQPEPLERRRASCVYEAWRQQGFRLVR